MRRCMKINASEITTYFSTHSSSHIDFTMYIYICTIHIHCRSIVQISYVCVVRGALKAAICHNEIIFYEYNKNNERNVYVVAEAQYSNIHGSI